MDGFHYDDLYLTPAGLRPRKGAPDTFDVGGLEHAVQRLRSRNADHVAVPIFDRQLEIARAGANPFLRRRESSWSRGTICFCAGSLGPACHRCSTSPFSSRPQMMSCVSGCQQGGGHTILRRTRLPRSSTATIYRTRGLLSRKALIRTFALRIYDRPLATHAGRTTIFAVSQPISFPSPALVWHFHVSGLRTCRWRCGHRKGGARESEDDGFSNCRQRWLRRVGRESFSPARCIDAGCGMGAGGDTPPA